MSGVSPDDGAEPINFRAALAAFEGRPTDASGPQLHAPVASRRSHTNKPNIAVVVSTRDAHEDAAHEPVTRSNSTPKIRGGFNGRSHLAANPFAAAEDEEARQPQDAGLLKAPWPALGSQESDASRLRKTGSGTSLRDLMQKSLPDGQNRSRSKSLAGRSVDGLSLSGRSTPTTSGSGTSSPRLGVRNIIALYGGQGGDPAGGPAAGRAAALSGANGGSDLLYGGGLRTSSPMSISSATSLRTRHMLDASNDDDQYDPLFGHAVMDPRPKSSSGLQSAPVSYPSSPQQTGPGPATAHTPKRGAAPPPFLRTVSSSQIMAGRGGGEPPPRVPARPALQPPSPPRRGSQSSTSSSISVGPRLPPRPPTGNAPPSVSEFGQISDRSSTAEAKAHPALASSDNAGHVSYATYTPGARRQPPAPSPGGHGGETGHPPPALPPRSATVGQNGTSRTDFSNGAGNTAEDGQLSYAVRTRSLGRPVPKSPSLPSSMMASTTPNAKAERPDPPPRPRMLQVDGNAGGFRFGGGASSTPSAPPAPPARGRPPVQTHHRGALGSMGSDPNSSSSSASSPTSTSTTVSSTTRGMSHSHAKSPSNVFTSISLSDDASRDLHHSLESDILQRSTREHPPNGPPSAPAAADGGHRLPPPRNRYGHSVNRSIGSTMGITSSPNLGQASAGKTLWESASSALPLPFKTSAASSASGRALAEGAPSRQQQFVPRPAGANDSMFGARPGESLNGARSNNWPGQLQIRPVQLASPTADRHPPRSTTPADDGARRRYEALFERCLKDQEAARAKQALWDDKEARGFGSARGKRQPSAKSIAAAFEASGARDRAGSQLSTHSAPIEDRDVSSGVGVEAAKGWFEPRSGSQTPTRASVSPPVSRSAPSGPLLATGPDKPTAKLSMGRIRKVWQRSRLPDRVLADIWDAAAAVQKASELGGRTSKGLGKEAFVRAMAAIDAELAQRATRRRSRLLRQRASGAAVGHGAPDQRSKSRLPNGGGGGGGGLYHSDRDGMRARPSKDGMGYGSAASRSSSVHSSHSRRGEPSSPSMSSGLALSHAPRRPVGLSSGRDDQRRSSGESDSITVTGGGGYPRRVPPPPVSRSSDP
ncbi:uncharacterized protein PFL1_01982 [Pseudozyma flocculosa PF-1]|uniref:Uncharacterized protein n=1 Tax=Pseudozyma flocculosa TaxID=84751 RepID=A0A5C3F1F0_9BASI|nr:uncharacterized protein PFL1_01982 [Pseudozyma flocculosa PF-1]EPQ30456.1 hypothetical protein PFL1_01982 [Pseudozyma flocculosa PF-1]SPO37537.1 uncharacterized protein PSFLO_03012 [Pseudozyma flocculosa]